MSSVEVMLQFASPTNRRSIDMPAKVGAIHLRDAKHLCNEQPPQVTDVSVQSVPA